MRYDSLFYDFGDLNPDRIRQSDIDLAESRLGLRLPLDYIELLKYQNGGPLLKNISHSATLNGKSASIAILQIYGVGGERGLDAIIDGETINQKLIRNWGYPDNSVVFAPQGSSGYAFDYDDIGEDGEPSILYRYCDCKVPITYPRVFQNFPHLLDSLEPPSNANDLPNET